MINYQDITVVIFPIKGIIIIMINKVRYCKITKNEANLIRYN